MPRCAAVSILDFVTGTGVASVNLSQNAPQKRWDPSPPLTKQPVRRAANLRRRQSVLIRRRVEIMGDRESTNT
jgi:hypothetical protein